jgi:hypothetical protein
MRGRLATPLIEDEVYLNYIALAMVVIIRTAFAAEQKGHRKKGRDAVGQK